jgi:hypothetical protein
MSLDLPPARGELLRALGSILLDERINGSFAIALTDDLDEPGALDLLLRDLPADDPIGALLGFRAPDAWDAFGVITSGTARELSGPAPPRPVRVVHMIDRHGVEVSLAIDTSDVPGGRPAIVDLSGPPQSCGRVPDTCRRVLGLPTPPPVDDPSRFWTVDWLDRVLAEVLRRDLGAPPITWEAVERLHRGRHPDVAPWAILRRECAAGQLSVGGLSSSAASWMDDGMFSRQVVAAYPECDELVADLSELLPPAVWQKVLARLQRGSPV